MPPQPQPLDGLIPSGHYRTPLATQVRGCTMAGAEGPARILLSLEGGYELEIPATQATIDELYRVMRSMTRNP
jgi:hypothetical protein